MPRGGIWRHNGTLGGYGIFTEPDDAIIPLGAGLGRGKNGICRNDMPPEALFPSYIEQSRVIIIFRFLVLSTKVL